MLKSLKVDAAVALCIQQDAENISQVEEFNVVS
jgi:hypothetical protein